MIRSLSAARSVRSAVVVLSTTVAFVLTACTPDASPPGGAPSSTHAPSTSAAARPDSGPATTPAASPTPSLPVAADGRNAGSCADGTCEVRVTASVEVPLPARFGLGPVRVTAIDARTVTLSARLTQSQFSSDGGCSSAITGPAANAPAHVDLTCHVGEKAVVNKMHLTVVGIAEHAAVLRIRAAT
ncbi:hypothetical protein [Streptomyces sulfonofaciens]|nr:hypothetical protein [Streptomyces sulfonofaciens]